MVGKSQWLYMVIYLLPFSIWNSQDSLKEHLIQGKERYTGNISLCVDVLKEWWGHAERI